MSGLVRVSFLLFAGLALGMAYNAWPIATDNAIYGGELPQAIDMVSYAGGLIVGMLLWEIGSVPWGELPGRAGQFLAAHVDFYRFVLLGGACLTVLIYF